MGMGRLYANSSVVRLPHLTNPYLDETTDMVKWCKKNSRGEVEFQPSVVFGLTVLFEYADDASFFSLKWS